MRIAVVALGRIGLPLAAQCAEKGREAIGEKGGAATDAERRTGAPRLTIGGGQRLG
ncbi:MULTISPECIES: hypothetical protein [Actinomyces]|uniref:UDP-glucose/GDP-mannose dehydrogenase N-terminal domain-containing protein n=1 Tax=Actinomyces marmotae TaxID=2737173 RepID=A0A6M8AZM2_9ACTO|nr:MULTISPECIES: hypothetical protein [Actinomyces]QKD78862.1 hypothetical protein HPC72_01890 [Actinomyces marmotae]